MGSFGGYVTHFFNLWDPLISPQWLKLETSSLAKRWTAESIDEKCKIRSKGVMGVTQPIGGIFGQPNIFGTNEARNFKFGTEMEGSEC